MDSNSSGSSAMGNREQGSAPEGTGYSSPGDDQIITSTSSAVPSPTKSAEKRLTTPAGAVNSLGETPGDSNPALAQTVAEETGAGTTAEMLLARETAEEQNLRNARADIYQDQGSGGAGERFPSSDTEQREATFGNRQNAATNALDSAEVTESFEGMDQGIGSMDLRARAEAMLDRAGSETAYTDSMLGRGPYGSKAEEYDAQGPEAANTFVPNEMDSVAPDMKNIPDEG